jgi:acyl carrier protein
MKYLDQLKSSVAEGQADPAAERLPASPAASPVASSVVGIIGAMFNVPLTEIDAGTVASDVPGWTSLAHAALILEVERQLRIRFGDQEIFGFATVGDLERRASQLQAERQSPVDDERTVLRTPTASIVRFDGAGPSTGTGPDLIIFAGRANKLGGMDLLDFASVLGKTAAGGLTKYYVTDLAADWYLSCFEEVVAKLNAVSTRPKLLLGNSMGGYAALRFSAALHNVVATLAFVPQRQPVRPAAKKLGVSGKAFRVGFAPSIAYCVLFGETEDDEDRAHLAGDVTDADRQRILTVRNCGHNVVPYLHSADLLGRVIDCLTRPTTFCDEVAAIVATIPADPVSLEQRQRYTERRRARVAARRAAKARPGVLPPAS